MKKSWRQRTYFWKKRQEALEKNLVCKFIRINTTDAQRGYDTDYEVIKIKIIISKFKEKKIKEKENKTKEIKKEKRKRQKIKELEDELKKLKLHLTNQSV